MHMVGFGELMAQENHYLTFLIDEEQYGLPLFAVTKVIRAVALIHFPAGNDDLLGLINMMGQIIPVVNVRKHFRVKERNMDINDRIIISRASSRPIAFIADRVEGIIELAPNQIDTTQQIIFETENCITGIGEFEGNTIKICDVDKFLTTLNDL